MTCTCTCACACACHAHATHMPRTCHRSPARPATPRGPHGADACRFWTELKFARALAVGGATVPVGEAAGSAAADGGAAAAEGGEGGAAAEGGAVPRAVLAMDLAAWVRCCTHLGIFPDLLGKAELSKARTACAWRVGTCCICACAFTCTYARAHARAHAHCRPSLLRRSPRRPSASSPRPSALPRPEHIRPPLVPTAAVPTAHGHSLTL